ncbi:hypothetical protein ACVI1J_005869 [Bradyrhizobium diazoefficiens]
MQRQPPQIVARVAFTALGGRLANRPLHLRCEHRQVFG